MPQVLADKVDRLLELCEFLSTENRLLKERESHWLQERSRLMEKNELARNRVEAMITRLKSLEEES